MKRFSLLIPVYWLLGLSHFPDGPSPAFASTSPICDTAIEEHWVDGNIQEWPASRFVEDKASGISYAIDNDWASLFIAVSIPDKGRQMRVSRSGMRLFLDARGKRRESRGLEFPVRRNQMSGFRPANQRGEGRTPGEEPEEVRQLRRQAISANLFAYRLFGIDDAESADRPITTEGELQIAFLWDDNDVLHFEYQLPLYLLGETQVADLQGRSISIGWKIFGTDRSVENPAATGVPTGGRGGRRGATNPANINFGGASGNRSGNSPVMLADQQFWGRYTVVFQGQ